MLIVRWLSCFRGKGDFYNQILWEIGQRERQVAAEPCADGYSKVLAERYVYVGLQARKSAVVKSYRSDVWSKVARNPKKDGVKRLIPTRRESESSRHGECFVEPGQFEAIVLIEHPSRLKEELRRQVFNAAQDTGLPVKYFHRGKLKILKKEEMR